MITDQRAFVVGFFLIMASAVSAMEPLILKGHTNAIISVEWSPDGKMIASCGRDGTVRIWNVAEKKEIALFRCGKARFHDAPGQTPEVRWNANGTLVGFRGSDWKVRVGEIKSGKELTVYDAAGKGVAAFDWHPDGRRIASAVGEAFDQETKESFDLWEAETGKVMRTWKPNDVANTTFVRWNPDGSRVAFGDNFGRVTIHDPEREMRIVAFEAQDVALQRLTWSPDGKNLATAGLDRAKKGYTAKVWNAANGKLTRTFPVAQLADSHLNVMWSPDGKTLAITDGSNFIALWNPSTGRRIWQNPFGAWFQWRPDGSTLLINESFLVDAKTGRTVWQNVAVRTLPAPWGTILGKQILGGGLRWRPDGLAVAGTHNIDIEYPLYSILVWDFPKPFPKPQRR